MPQLHDIGKKHFVHTMAYPTKKFPILDRGETQEIEEPYRLGRSWVVRVPLTRWAFVAGRWVSEQPEDSALTRAIKARPLDVA